MVRGFMFALGALLVSPCLADEITLSVGDALNTADNAYVACTTSSGMEAIAEAMVESDEEDPNNDQTIADSLKANDCEYTTGDNHLIVRDLPVFTQKRKHAEMFTTAFAAEMVDSHTEVWIIANTKDELKIKRPEFTPSASPDTGEPGAGEEDASVPPEDDAPTQWLATAQSMWRDRKGLAHVAVGFSGTAETADAASAAAIQACKKAGGRGCKVIGPFSTGCLYITTGQSKKGVAYGSGATPEAAATSCRKQGYKCQKPIGGCLE